MKKFLVLLSVLSGSTYAQLDSTYIKKFPKAITIKPFIAYKLNSLSISDDKSKSLVDYQTVQIPRIGIGATYRWMSFLTAIAPLYKVDEKEKGANNQMDIQWNLYLKALVLI